MDPHLPRPRKILWLAHNRAWIVVPFTGREVPQESSFGVLDYLLHGALRDMVSRAWGPFLFPTQRAGDHGERITQGKLLLGPKVTDGSALWLFGEGFFFRGMLLLFFPPLSLGELVVQLLLKLPRHLSSLGPVVVLPPPKEEREIPTEFWYTLPHKIRGSLPPFPREYYFVRLL